MGWEVGDLALCIRGGNIDHPKPLREYPRAGAIYRVDWVGRVKAIGGSDVFLWIEGGPPNSDGNALWWEQRFRKITPTEADDFDREIIELMNGERIPETTKTSSSRSLAEVSLRPDLGNPLGADSLRPEGRSNPLPSLEDSAVQHASEVADD